MHIKTNDHALVNVVNYYTELVKNSVLISLIRKIFKFKWLLIIQFDSQKWWLFHRFPLITLKWLILLNSYFAIPNRFCYAIQRNTFEKPIHKIYKRLIRIYIRTIRCPYGNCEPRTLILIERQVRVMLCLTVQDVLREHCYIITWKTDDKRKLLIASTLYP
jgi:hypothetical protein